MSRFPDMSLPLPASPSPAGSEPAPSLPWSHTGITIDLLGDGRPWHVEITWAPVDGRPEPVGVAAHRGCQPARDGLYPLGDGPAPLTAAACRKIPVAALARGMRPMLEDANEGHAAVLASYHDDDRAQQAREAVARSRQRPRRAGRPRVLDDSHLSAVAAIYDAAWRQGHDPTHAVADTLVISRSAAAKQIARARHAGHLPATTRGKARGNGKRAKEKAGQ